MVVNVNLHGRLTIWKDVANILPHKLVKKLNTLDESILIISGGTNSDVDTLRSKGLEVEKVGE